MGSEEADWSGALEKLRPLLNLLARQNVNPRLWKSVDLSGVVQETLMEALKNRGQFRGNGAPDLGGWVRRILLHNLQDAIRGVHRDRRDVDREVPIADALDETTGRLQRQLSVREASPSEVLVRSEELLHLAVALERLEPAQREAVELHHLQGRSLAETAAILGRSESAAAALLHRGLRKLKDLLKEG